MRLSVRYYVYSLGLLLALAPCFLFTLTLKRWPDSWDEYASMGYMLLLSGSPEAGIHQFREAVRVQPGDIQHLELGVALAQAGHPKEARIELQEALRLNHELGIYLVQRTRVMKGMEQFQEVVPTPPNAPDGHFSLGKLLLELDLPQEAIDQFEQALKLSPNNETYEKNLNRARAALNKKPAP